MTPALLSGLAAADGAGDIAVSRLAAFDAKGTAGEVAVVGVLGLLQAVRVRSVNTVTSEGVRIMASFSP